MYLHGNITRSNNRLHAEFQNGIWRMFNYNIDYISNTVYGTMRSYADIDAYSYGGYSDDGRQIDDRGFVIARNTLEQFLDTSITDAFKQIEKAIYAYLVTTPEYSGFTLVLESGDPGYTA